MIETVAAQTGDVPQEVLADSGYCSEANLACVAAHGIDAYVATERLKRDVPLPPCRGPRPALVCLTHNILKCLCA